MKQQGKKNLPTSAARSDESILVITESLLVIPGASRVAAVLLVEDHSKYEGNLVCIASLEHAS